MSVPDHSGEEPKHAAVVYNPAKTPLDRLRALVARDPARLG